MGKTLTLNDGRLIKLRPMTLLDEEGLADLYREVQGETERVKVPSEEELYRKFRFPDYYISIITEHDGTVVGYGEILKDPEKKNGELQIHIHREYQGVGLGTAIMILLLKEATDQKLQRIDLEVSAENQAAIHLFRKFGFQQVKSVREEEEPGLIHETLHMNRVLNK